MTKKSGSRSIFSWRLQLAAAVIALVGIILSLVFNVSNIIVILIIGCASGIIGGAYAARRERH
jgi:hypothetical protein